MTCEITNELPFQELSIIVQESNNEKDREKALRVLCRKQRKFQKIELFNILEYLLICDNDLVLKIKTAYYLKKLFPEKAFTPLFSIFNISENFRLLRILKDLLISLDISPNKCIEILNSYIDRIQISIEKRLNKKVSIDKWDYGDYKTNNYAGHTQAIRIGSLTLYFSYKTVVAFSNYKFGFVISENVWSNTTGKHLNWIDSDKKKRIPHNEFEKLLNKVLGSNNLIL